MADKSSAIDARAVMLLLLLLLLLLGQRLRVTHDSGQQIDHIRESAAMAPAR